jgi:integrase
MSLFCREDSKVWWLSFNANGKRIRVSTGTENRRQAETIHAKVLTQIAEGKWFESTKGKAITFRELWEKYAAKYCKQRDPYTIKHLLPGFGGMVLSGITTDMIEDYILERAGLGASASTIYNEFALGRRMFNVARKKWKWIKDNPWADVEFSELQNIANERDRWLSVEEEGILLANATPDAYLPDVIIFALHTGCRRGEILSCEWRQNIDMHRRIVSVQASKGGNKKVIPMSETLYQMLLKRSKIRDIAGRVFPIEATTLKDSFERAVKKAGLEDFHFHDLRHTFATRLIQNGVDLYAVKQMMGHRSIKTTERYAHHYPESLRPTVKVLDDCYRVEKEFGHVLVTFGDSAVCLTSANQVK